MRDVFMGFLRKFLGQGFPEYPEHLLSEVWDAFLEVRETFLADVVVKHPAYNQGVDPALFRLMIFDPTLEGIFYYRVERKLFLSDEMHPLLPYLAALMRIRTGMELYYSTEIGAGFSIQHGFGIVIGPRFIIGRNFSIYQGVTLGQGRRFSPEQRIVIGDDVVLFAGVKVVGHLSIGNNVQVGANAVVTSDLPSNGVYAGVPAKLVRAIAPLPLGTSKGSKESV